ncbi:Fumarylacetoacetate hydrolase domain-containing protein 2 [Daldinia childiae]|uniref:Fumarylacetoacetate hydrolase domain-containing protein 2 n=1 Tax=Daldinia childiae TaxID=326645 RepID=UPI00144503CC|nr:Fumarylacetoacetate hydrolase domain-containing protein 2 [Daldinia childiae]KAF3065027.1 Fumarylacetoacetate hydrolase domain-containing protein 2 [Daldinia childiae]
MSSPTFTNLIRFLDESSVKHYGDVINSSLDSIVGSVVQLLEGDLFSLRRTDKTAVVHKLLSPVPSTPLFVCIGLNYADHAKEANLAIPPNPVIFTKPSDALTGPYSDVPVPPEAELMDYEGELCIVISKTGKNIPEDKALDYVLGVTAGNDLSSRKWQRPPYSGGQFTYAKSFDYFAPIGPTILNGSLITSNAPLKIKTTVNGEVRQNGSTSDMLFNIEKIIAHASRGTTLRQGTIIMTGTPAGIAAKWPGQPWLKDGDVVEVDISGIGSLRNKLVFEKES